MRTETTLFHEEQRFRQAWIWVLMFFCCAVPMALITHDLYRALVFGEDFRGKPQTTGELLLIGALTYGFCLGILWLMVAMYLRVRVFSSHLYVRFFPFRTKNFPMVDIESFEACTYRPILHYGGWGLRYRFRRGWCYNVSGNKGVRFVFKDGKKLLVGSQKPEEFARALQQAKEGA